VTKDLATAEGTLQWRGALELGNYSAGEGTTVRSAPTDYPMAFSMGADDLRSLLVNGDVGLAEVELPFRVALANGKEVLRDSEGRMQGVVERTFADVSLDRSQESA